MHPIIRVDNLSKQYRLGSGLPGGYRTLRESLASLAAAPLQRFANRRAGRDAPATRSADDTLWALKDVSFEVNEGEVVGIIGRNGAGKSTLLKILSRITEPTSGRIELRGRVASLLEVGTGFHPELTGRENIYMNGSILGMSRREIDRKFDEIVDFSGVERFLDTPVKRYSSGMTVRLAFAVAAHLEPEILIVDEVLAVGDAEFQKKCLGKMQSVARTGRTVLFVSHNMAAVESLCQRGIVLESGQLVMASPVDRALRYYRDRVGNNSELDFHNALSNARYFRDAKVIGPEGTPTNYVAIGESITFSFSLAPPHVLRSPKIGIGIDNALGQRILTFHNPIDSAGMGSIVRPTQIHCAVAWLPLAPGDYFVKVALTDSNQELETISPVLAFSVQDGNLFNEGRGFHRGVCVAPCEWRAVAIDAEHHNNMLHQGG